MPNIVVIPGSWLGAWAWRDVANPLRAAGHDVHALTLTGFGDRAHLARAADFETHVADIVGHLETEELDDVVLVAHSYSGAPATVAATRAAGRIRKLVYVAGFVPTAGKTLFQQLPPFVTQEIKRYVERGLIQVAPDDVLDKYYGDHALHGEPMQRFRSHASGHPVACYEQTVDFDAPTWEALDRTYVFCSGDPGEPPAGPGWQHETLPTGHWPMFTAPDATAALLDAISRRA